MAFFDFLFQNKKTTSKEPNLSTKFFSGIAHIIKPKSPVSDSRENFEFPALSLYDIKRAVATDSYIAESLNKYKEKIFKAGYVLKGEDEVVDYIKKRFAFVDYMGEIPFDIFLQEVADDLITYSNVYLYKIRNDKIPMPIKGYYDTLPVAGYIRLDPCSVIIVTDKYGNILRYEIEQERLYERQKILPKDMIHIAIDRKAGSKYGTPRLESVLEDIKALREIEGDVLTLIHRFCFPLYHVKVGLAQPGYNGTQTEIDDIKNKIYTMQEDGMLITNEKIEVTAIGAENNALDIANYLSYFEKRAFTGLNTSETQMGRDNNNTNPEAIEAQVHDTVKFFQRILATYIENGIINEFLLEGGYNPILNESERVKWVFNEISLDTRIKLENHEMLKYQSNIQTLEETREDIGKRSLEDADDLFVENVTNNSALKQIKAKSDEAIRLAKVNSTLSANTVSATSSNTKNSNQGNGKTKSYSNKAATNNNRPANQHGIYSVKIKESLKELDKIKKFQSKTYKIYEKMRNDFNDSILYQADITALKSNYNNLLTSLSKEAFAFYAKATNHTPHTDVSTLRINPIYYENLIATQINHLDKSLQEKMQTHTLDEAFDSLSYRLKFMTDYVSRKYMWHTFAEIAFAEGYQTLQVKFHSDKDKETHYQLIDLHEYAEKDIPPFHAFCQCELHLPTEVI